MTTERFEKRAGDNSMIGVDDPTMMLVGDVVPDNVTLPSGLGGGVMVVSGSFVADCPVTGIKCRHLALGEYDGKTLYVAESDQFYWYAK